MALHVTKCPSCESTFNTSAAMLQLAEGKVRCGSCLSIFHAIDNFIQPASNEDSQDEESVFVGNSPEDYFDPAIFLTRSALQQDTVDEEAPAAADPEIVDDAESFERAEISEEIEAEPPITEDSLELSEEYTKEFFEAIENSMEESLREAESEKDALMQELQASETSFFEDFQAPLLSESESLSPELFPDNSDQLADPFAVKQEAQASRADNDVFEYDPARNHEDSSESSQKTEEFGDHTITETETPQPPEDLFPDSVEQPEDEELPPSNEFVAHSITEMQAPNSPHAANSPITEENDDYPTEEDSSDLYQDQQQDQQEDQWEEAHTMAEDNQDLHAADHPLNENNAEPNDRESNQQAPTENLPSDLVTKTVSESKPEDIQLSVSFSMQRGPIVRPSEPEDSPDSAQAEQNSEAKDEPAPHPQASADFDTDEEEEYIDEDAPLPNLLSESPEEEIESASENDELPLEDIPSHSSTELEEDGEEELNQEIVEHDFKESIAEGLENPESEFADALFGNPTSALTPEQSITTNTAETDVDIPHIDSDIEDRAATQESLASSDQNDDEESFAPSMVEDSNEYQEDQEENKEAESDEQEIEDSTEEIRARALDTELEDEGALESIPEENLAALDVSSTPVELLAGQQSRWGKRIAFGFLAILLGGGLGSQYLWYNMTAYSQDLRARPFYELACNYTTCNLPDYSNVAAIRSDTLEVRSHPQLDNGLVVNIEFRNTAPFPQAFPIMILSFNSATNDIVALREFSPTEYLDPGLREIAMMPSMSPVQVSLEIIDPGPGAVNYTLAFRLP